MRTADHKFGFMNFQGEEEKYPWLVICEDYPRKSDHVYNVMDYQSAFNIKIYEYGGRSDTFNYCFVIDEGRAYAIFKHKIDAIHFKLTWRAPDLRWPTR